METANTGCHYPSATKFRVARHTGTAEELGLPISRQIDSAILTIASRNAKLGRIALLLRSCSQCDHLGETEHDCVCGEEEGSVSSSGGSVQLRHKSS